jgi:hypothetical protein
VYGELGVAAPPEECGASRLDCSMRPVRVEGDLEFTSIQAGTFFTCGLTPAAGVHCWGQGHHGRLGDGRVEHSRTPVGVQSSSGFTQLGVGSHRACALDAGGNTYCWGNSILHLTGERPVINPLPVRSAPEEPLGSLDLGWGLCGIRMDGIAVCRGEATIDEVPGQ